MKQETALNILQTGANVFLTGEPGSGKTHTINRYVAWLREHGITPAITASTGIAATHIGGMTIHAWCGIGVKRELSSRDLDFIAANSRVARRITRTHILIIDEVSMLSADTLAMVEMVCRRVRQSSEPFGGLKVVFVGDFFQLPPIMPVPTRPEGPRATQNGAMRLGFGEGDAGAFFAPFAFRSRAWEVASPLVCYLSEQHRQEDAEFLALLSAVRSGNTDWETHETLGTRRVEESRAPADLPRLYAHNANVDRVNTERLASIQGKAREFVMTSRGPEMLVATLKRGCLSPETLSLKIGARVMFTKNNPDGSFVNGTLGEIEKFTEDGNPVVRTLKGRRIYVEPMEWMIVDGTRTLARIIQMPLRLAWALTIHKSQGMTLDAAVMDLSEVFEYGQGYVALSRVRSLSGLHLLGWNTRALEVHPDMSVQDQDFKQRSQEVQHAFAAMREAEHTALVRKFILACEGKPPHSYMSGGGKPEGSLRSSLRLAEGGVRAQAKNGKQQGSTLDATLQLLKNGKLIAEIARERELAKSTILSHVCQLHAAGRIDRATLEPLITPALRRALPMIHAAFKELGTERLAPVFEKLRGAYSYDDLRFAQMLME